MTRPPLWIRHLRAAADHSLAIVALPCVPFFIIVITAAMTRTP